MTTPLRRDWAWKMQMYLGYMVVEDEEQLRAFNACIKAIRRQKSKQNGNIQKSTKYKINSTTQKFN